MFCDFKFGFWRFVISFLRCSVTLVPRGAWCGAPLPAYLRDEGKVRRFFCFLVGGTIALRPSWLAGGSDGKESACGAGDPASVLGGEDPLEEAMAPHSSALAWETPWTGEPGGPQAAGRRVGQAERLTFAFRRRQWRGLRPLGWAASGRVWERRSPWVRGVALCRLRLSLGLRASYCFASVGAAVSWGWWALARVWDPRGVGSALEEEEDWRGAALCSHLHHAGCCERPGLCPCGLGAGLWVRQPSASGGVES